MTCSVFFNLDDTLTSFDRSFDAIYRDAVAEAGIEAVQDDYETYKKRFFSYFGKRAFPRRQAMEDLLRDNDMYEADSVETFATAWEDAEAEAVELKDGAEQVLDELSGRYSIGVVTNGTGRLQRMKLEQTGIMQYFDSVLISGECGVSKPDTRFFELAMDELPADTYVMVSHLAKRDIVAAVDAGMDGVWIGGEDGSLPAEVAMTVGSLHEVPGTVDGIVSE